MTSSTALTELDRKRTQTDKPTPIEGDTVTLKWALSMISPNIGEFKKERKRDSWRAVSCRQLVINFSLTVATQSTQDDSKRPLCDYTHGS